MGGLGGGRGGGGRGASNNNTAVRVQEVVLNTIILFSPRTFPVYQLMSAPRNQSLNRFSYLSCSFHLFGVC